MDASLLAAAAQRMEGFSGREIAKFMASVQAAVYGGHESVLTREMFEGGPRAAVVAAAAAAAAVVVVVVVLALLLLLLLLLLLPGPGAGRCWHAGHHPGAQRLICYALSQPRAAACLPPAPCPLALASPPARPPAAPAGVLAHKLREHKQREAFRSGQHTAGGEGSGGEAAGRPGAKA